MSHHGERPRPADMVPTGPFELPPREVGRMTTRGFDPAVAPGEVAAAVYAWLVEVLDGCGVALGAEDVEVAREIADDLGWADAQVVAGWVARAYRHGPEN